MENVAQSGFTELKEDYYGNNNEREQYKKKIYMFWLKTMTSVPIKIIIKNF